MDRLKLFSLAPEAYRLLNGETVYIRRFTATDRLDWIEYLGKQNPNLEIRDSLDISARLLCLTLADETGARLFKDGEEKEILASLNERDFNGVAKVSVEVNGLFAEAEVEAKKN